MTDGVDAWNRLAALLPPDPARDFQDCWAIGEQEAGLGVLVSGLLGNDVPIGETVRAEISVLAEVWGELEALTPRIRQCRGDGRPSAVTLVEQDDILLTDLTADSPSAGLVPVAWIACTRCGAVLTRVHIREEWGELSYLAESYAITTPDRTALAWHFPFDAADRAFAELLGACGGRA